MKIRAKNQIFDLPANTKPETLKALFPEGFEIVEKSSVAGLTSEEKRIKLGIAEEVWQSEFVPAIASMQEATDKVAELLRQHGVKVACGCYIGNKETKKS